MVGTPPLVSCLCVTRGKPQKLRRAVDCFLAQTWARKELLLVYEDDDAPTAAFASDAAARHPELVVAVRLPATPKLALGELRNVAISRARGEYFCQWDDDDWYHEQRLARQVEAVTFTRRPACLLTNWLIYDEVDRQAYFSHFRPWEGSILCRTNVITPALRYPPATRQEDSLFTNMLLARGLVFPLVAAGLYIYTVHASNTWPREHFNAILALSQRLGAPATALIADILAGRHSVAEASRRLHAPEFLAELVYFPEFVRRT